MKDQTNIIEIPYLIQKEISRRLTFTNEGLTIEKVRSFDPPVFIGAKDISAFRFGVNWITGYKFTFGRQYIVQILDSENRISSVKLNSYYQIRRKAYGEIWSKIINQLWKNFFINTYNYYHDLYSVKQEFTLADVKFHPFGISWYDGSLFWNEIALSNYRTYFMIHHKDDLKKIKRCSFKNDWNALILQTLLKEIIKEHAAYNNLASQ
jgi:hypothetical protein